MQEENLTFRLVNAITNSNQCSNQPLINQSVQLCSFIECAKRNCFYTKSGVQSNRGPISPTFIYRWRHLHTREASLDSIIPFQFYRQYSQATVLHVLLQHMQTIPATVLQLNSAMIRITLELAIYPVLPYFKQL